MTQSRAVSLIETVVHTTTGFLTSFLVWPMAAWLWAFPYTVDSHIGVVSLFTVVSIARGYVVRRYFNRHFQRWVERLAKKWPGA